MQNEVNKLLEIFKALSCKARFDIVLMLIKNQEYNVSKLSEELNIPQPNVSQHLAILKNVRIIEGFRNGNQIYYKVIDEQTKNIINALNIKLSDYWEHLE